MLSLFTVSVLFYGSIMFTVSLRFFGGGLLTCIASTAFAAMPVLTNDPSQLARTALGRLPGTAVVGMLQADRPSYGAAGEQAKSEQLLFGIGSISKVFTGLLLAQAVERGELKLDTTLDSLKLTAVPLPPKVGAITLRQLATHTSCLPNDPNDIAQETDMAHMLANYPRTRLWSALASQRMDRSGPCAAEYSNLGFAVLGEALASHYRTSWEQLVHERITEPLGMSDTVSQLASKEGRLATAYRDGEPVAPLREWGAFVGAGGLYSSARDMLTFSRALLAGRQGLLGAAAERVLQPLHGSVIAYGIDIRGYPDQPTYNKDGRTAGFSSYWIILPDTREALIVLASNSNASLNGVSRNILARRYPAPRPLAAGRSDNLPDYAGVYRVNDKSAFTFVARNGLLYGCLTGQSFSQLLPAGNDTFVLPGASAAFSFTRDRDRGRVKTAILRQLGTETVAQRIDEVKPLAGPPSGITHQKNGGCPQSVPPGEKADHGVQAHLGS